MTEKTVKQYRISIKQSVSLRRSITLINLKSDSSGKDREDKNLPTSEMSGDITFFRY